MCFEDQDKALHPVLLNILDGSFIVPLLELQFSNHVVLCIELVAGKTPNFLISSALYSKFDPFGISFPAPEISLGLVSRLIHSPPCPQIRFHRWPRGLFSEQERPPRNGKD